LFVVWDGTYIPDLLFRPFPEDQSPDCTLEDTPRLLGFLALFFAYTYSIDCT
jgi:hypothetical protein